MSRVSIIAFTAAGCRVARRIEEHLRCEGQCEDVRLGVYATARVAATQGARAVESLDAWTRKHFASDDALVFVGASGIAVRAIAPYVRDKFSDPAVVSVDERGSFAVALLGGHVGGANRLARAVARACGGRAVVGTATDVNGLFAVDEWAHDQGLAIVERDVAKEVSASLLEGAPVGFSSEVAIDGDLPAGVVRVGAGAAQAALGCDSADAEQAGASSSSFVPRVGFHVGCDLAREPFARTLHLVPRTTVVGVGARRGARAEALAAAIDDALHAASLPRESVCEMRSIDVKRDEPAIAQVSSERGWPVRFLSAEQLAQVPGAFAASEFVRDTVGVDNVCGRAAAWPDAELVLDKQVGAGVTVALARKQARISFPEGLQDGGELALGWEAPSRADGWSAEAAGATPDQQHAGKLYVVGLGPGAGAGMTRRAQEALARCEVITGYTTYVELVRGMFPAAEILPSPMRKEVDRCHAALAAAAGGKTVGMVCSGDPGVYGMAGLCFELADEFSPVDIEVVAGVSAANGGAAVLGAPLMHDFCAISLSDLLTPWDAIAERLRAAARSGFVICLYNPASRKRSGYLVRACDILLEELAPTTVCGYVRNIERAGEEGGVTTLGELRDMSVDMFTTVYVGNATTRCIGGKMVTPRGYFGSGE